MTTAGPNLPGLGADSSAAGSLTWSNPTRIETDGGGNDASASVVSASSTTPVTSHYLVASDFGFAIPSGATVNGIIVSVTRRASAPNGSKDSVIRLAPGGTLAGDNKADTVTGWGTTYSTVSYGGATDTWGLSLTGSDVNDADFAVYVQTTITSTFSQSVVDCIKVTVDYTASVTSHRSVSSTSLLKTVGSRLLQSTTVLSGASRRIINSVTKLSSTAIRTVASKTSLVVTATLTANASTTNWGRLSSGALNDYSAARSGGSIDVSTTLLRAGQNFDTSTTVYSVQLGYLQFDTSAIPANATIRSATLKLAIASGNDFSDRDFTLQARAFDYGTSLTSGDYLSGTTYAGEPLCASLTTNGIPIGSYFSLNENGTTFRSNINRGGITRLVLGSDRFASGSTPTGHEFVQLIDPTDASLPPQLVIVYVDNARLVSSLTLLSNTPVRAIQSLTRLIQTNSRTVQATTGLKATLARTLATTAALKATLSRTVASSTALTATLNRTVQATTALKATVSRTFSSTSILTLRFARTLQSSTALTAVLNRTVQTSVALKATMARTVQTATALKATVARTLQSTTALTARLSRSVQSTALFRATQARTVQSTTVIFGAIVKRVSSSTALKATLSRTLSSTAVLTLRFSRTVQAVTRLKASVSRTLNTTTLLNSGFTRRMQSTTLLQAIATRRGQRTGAPQPSLVTLHLYTPLPTASPLVPLRFATADTSLVIVTSSERGFESAQIGFPVLQNGVMRPAWLPEPVLEYADYGHVVASDGHQVLFLGRANQSPTFVGGQIRAVTAQGYWDALNDGYFASSDDTITTTGAVIELILAQRLSSARIDRDNWADPGVAHAPSEFDGQRGGQAVDSLLKEGSADGTYYDLQFWADQTGQLIARLVSRMPPLVPDYEVPWYPDRQVVDLSYDPSQLYSHLRGRYTDLAGTAQVTDWHPALTDTSFLDQFGFQRRLEIDLGKKTSAGAEQLIATMQAQQSQRQWGGTVRSFGEYVLYYAGTQIPVPRREILGGQWLRVSGGPDVLLQIQRARHEVLADTLELTVSQGVTQRTLQQRIVETVSAVRTARNPISGAPTT